ncbi:hypothetical protein J6590_056685 [Homalodisca vitripennis]|nr:hypothetical protein J6590_056685 [Homalodisca vitripennis]
MHHFYVATYICQSPTSDRNCQNSDFGLSSPMDPKRLSSFATHNTNIGLYFFTLVRGIDMLILNAGVFALPHSLTEDGLETTFQVNHLSQFYLTLLLEDLLARASSSRVVFVSSESHRFSTLNVDNMSEEWFCPKPQNYWSMMAYNDSKLCNVLVANELARRWASRDILVFSCHPGNMVSSNISRHWCPYRLLFILVRPFTKSLEQAASTQAYCATAPELSDVSGLFFNNFCCRNKHPVCKYIVQQLRIFPMIVVFF